MQGNRVAEWVKHAVGLPQYVDAFRQNSVTVGLHIFAPTSFLVVVGSHILQLLCLLHMESRKTACQFLALVFTKALTMLVLVCVTGQCPSTLNTPENMTRFACIV